jgi:hypothetical protein
MALLALEKAPVSAIFFPCPFRAAASLGPGLRTASGAKGRPGGHRAMFAPPDHPVIRDIGEIRRFVCAICLRAVASWSARVLPQSESF